MSVSEYLESLTDNELQEFSDKLWDERVRRYAGNVDMTAKVTVLARNYDMEVSQ